MSQTRRLAAILAADVAGYSRLMGADEEGTLDRLKALAASSSIRKSPSITAVGAAVPRRVPGRLKDLAFLAQND
jgi:hypothetical protein